jgi:hypothetical protein
MHGEYVLDVDHCNNVVHCIVSYWSVLIAEYFDGIADEDA